jgi:arylformamidase
MKRLSVYRDYTQEELNAQYNQATLVSDITVYREYWSRAGLEASASLKCELDVPYGPEKVELLDIFPAMNNNSPIHIHIHGGAWRQLGKEDVRYPAPNFVAAGATFIPLNFGLTPDYSISEIINQIRSGVKWVWKNAASFNGRPDKIFISGASSGAHLAANLLSDDWQRNFELPENVIKGAVLASGPYDLEPVRLSARNDYLNLSQIEADNNNPLKHIPQFGPKIVICWGDGELDEFQRQGQAYADAWQAAGNLCDTIVLEGLNHFDVTNEYGRVDCALFNAVLKQMSL